MRDKSDPAAVLGTAGRARKSALAKKKRRDLPADNTTRQVEYWLYVDRHGVEHRLTKEKPRESLHVIVAGGHETTRVFHYQRKFGWKQVRVQPRGNWWFWREDGSIGAREYSVWSREVRQ